MGAFANIGALAGGYGQAWEEDTRRKFESEMTNRKNQGELLTKIATDPNSTPEQRQAALQELENMGKAPVGTGKKPYSVDFGKVLQPQAPAPGPGAPPTPGTPGATPTAPLPAPPTGAAPAGIQPIPAPPMSEQIPGVGGTPVMPGGVGALPRFATSPTTGMPVDTATGQEVPRASVPVSSQAPRAPVPAPVAPVPPPPDVAAPGWLASPGAVAQTQAGVAAIHTKAQAETQRQIVRQQLEQNPAFRALSPADQASLIFDPEGKGVGALPLLRMSIPGFDHMTPEDQQRVVERKLGAGMPFSMLKPVAGRPVQGQDGKWYLPYHDPMSGNEVYKVEMAAPPAYAPQVSDTASQDSSGIVTHTHTERKRLAPGGVTTPTAPPGGGAATPGGAPARPQAKGGAGTPAKAPTSQTGAYAGLPDDPQQTPSLYGPGVTPQGRNSIKAAAVQWTDKGMAPSGRLKAPVTAYMQEAGLTAHTPAEVKMVDTATSTAVQADKRFNMMWNVYQQTLKNPANVGSLDAALFSYHLGMTLGEVKGMRGGKDMYKIHLAARSLPESMQVAFEHWASGAELSPEQRQNFIRLAYDKRNAEWQAAADTAQHLGFRNIPKAPAIQGLTDQSTQGGGLKNPYE